MLASLLAPRSVAVVGVSTCPGTISRQALAGLRRHGFPGPIAAVNPSADEIDGTACYPSLKDLPEPAELVLVFVGAERVPGVLAEAADAGAGAAVVFSSGFSEAGPTGAELQAEVRRLARDRRLRVLGPNCQGLCDFRSPLVATFTPAAFRDDLPPVAPFGYVGQSGAVGGSFFDLCRFRGLTPAAWVSTGNQADLDVVEVAAGLIEGGGLDLLCLYLEQVPLGTAWRQLLDRAGRAGTRLAVLRSGRSAAGRRAAASHTGALVRPDRAFELLGETAGVVTVDDVDELVDIAVGLRGRLDSGGRSLGILTTSGGAGSIAADVADAHGLVVAPLGAGTRAALTVHIPDYGAVANPVDVTAQLMTANPEDFAAVCRTVTADPAVESLLVVLTNVTGPTSEGVADALARLGAAVPVSVAYLAAPDATAGARATLAAGHVAVFNSVAAAVRVVDRLSRPPLAGPIPALRPAAPLEAPCLPPGTTLTEWSGAPLLDALGIGRPEGRLTRDPAEAMAVARNIGEPVVLKVVSAQLLHKSEHGGVRVGVDPDVVAAVFDEMVARVSTELPDAVIDGVLVQRCARPGVQLLVGVTGAADGYPPIVTVGIGGTSVEIYADVATALAPLDETAAAALLARLRGFPLLAGHRGAPPADVEAAAAAIAGLSRAAMALGPELAEIEVNPLIVHGRGAGVTAVDLLVRRQGAAA